MSLSFLERASLCQSKVAARLFELCERKKTNLALSADVITQEELLFLADTLGPYICVLKTHIDIIADFTPTLPKLLRELALTHQFLLFEDRKFADIGHTVKHQFAGGIYHIAKWADIVNAHAIPGSGIIKGLLEGLTTAGRQTECGLLLIAEMSSQGHLLDQAYQTKTLQLAENQRDFVMGFITQHQLSKDKENAGFVNMTPGVQLHLSSDKLGQQYVTPEKAIKENGTDIIIVGRGITAATDKSSMIALAEEYRERSWKSYLQRLALG